MEGIGANLDVVFRGKADELYCSLDELVPIAQ